jgi:hypothetical protein
MKKFYLVFAIIAVINMIINIIQVELEGKSRIELVLSLLIALVSLGFYDIVTLLNKGNKEVITRDPKTGRFKKC